VLVRNLLKERRRKLWPQLVMRGRPTSVTAKLACESGYNLTGITKAEGCIVGLLHGLHLRGGKVTQIVFGRAKCEVDVVSVSMF
jgi:hypothetical protein